MEHLRGSIAAVLVVVLVCCVISAVPGLAQPGDAERRLYVGTMVAVPFAQDLHHQTSFILPETSPVLPGAELSAAGDMEIGYGLGFAAILGREISTYAALELTGSWSKQPADLVVSLPAILMQGFSNSDLELPAGFSFAGKIVILQSKIDLLIYPTKIATDSGGAQPYLGGGVGIVRSDIDMDIEKDVPTQAFIEELEESGFAELLPQKNRRHRNGFSVGSARGRKHSFQQHRFGFGLAVLSHVRRRRRQQFSRGGRHSEILVLSGCNP
jgi:opacity protein-like surface antigen